MAISAVARGTVAAIFAAWLAVCQLSCLALSSIDAMSPELEHAVIYKQRGIYAAFPDLFEDQDGALVIRFVTKVSSSHIDPTGGSKVLVSTDGGRTWRAPDRTRLNPAFETAEGRHVIPAPNGWRRAPAAEVESLRARGIVVQQDSGAYYYAVGAHVRTTADGGRTWAREELHLPGHALLMGYHDAAYLRTGRGVRLLALYGALRPGDPYQVFLLRSTDDARTWQFRPMLAPDQRGSVGFSEAALVELPDGAILAMMRPDPDSIGDLYSALSTDDGATWTTPRRTSLRGYPADLLPLRDGRIFCVFGYRRDPMGIRAAILDRDGAASGPAFILRDDAEGLRSNVGYPVAVQTSDDTILDAYYITTGDGITHVASTIVHLDDEDRGCPAPSGAGR
ncbi:MAG: exo-alpha-sialidase [Polyangiaceae bacterium]|nr:exo-alpha-sialidase [Polyangiaceae bacterium]